MENFIIFIVIVKFLLTKVVQKYTLSKNKVNGNEGENSIKRATENLSLAER